MDELKDTLDEKKEELEKLQERESSLTVTLNNTIGDGNKFEAFLIKMYKKKIKRVKKKASNEGNTPVSQTRWWPPPGEKIAQNFVPRQKNSLN